MKKVVINVDYGGFGLSTLAEVEYFRKKYHDKKVTLEGRKIGRDIDYTCLIDGEYPSPQEYTYYNDREDPILIEIIEKLGEKANGKCAQLEVVEIPDDVEYVIDDYDGNETIEEVHRSWR